ncbi:MAG: hypothetical protein OXH68_17110 [Gammaproteobacteria bacterium]|nr:hypothetical protein [Gammaproteobacteria bacterium]
MRTALAMTAFAASIAVSEDAVATDFRVPQGGGKLPTIALVECLAEEGSRSEGEYCRTTYECSSMRDGTEVSGTLWEGLTYHDGRRVTLGTDQIANQRACKLTVDDDAKVTYYTAYRPDGPGGEIVAFTRTSSSTSTHTTGSFSVSPNNMLGQFLSHNSVRADTLDDWVDRVCADIEDEDEETTCRRENDNAGFYVEGIAATEKTGCYVETTIRSQLSNERKTWLRKLVTLWSDRGAETSCGDDDGEDDG